MIKDKNFYGKPPLDQQTEKCKKIYDVKNWEKICFKAFGEQTNLAKSTCEAIEELSVVTAILRHVAQIDVCT